MNYLICFLLIISIGYSESRLTKVKKRISAQLEASLQEKGFQLGEEVYLRVFKSESEMELHMRPTGEKEFQLYRTYHIAGMSGVLGPKQKEGDYQAPEGCYEIVKGNLNPKSSYHLSFNIGYPNRFDRNHGRTGSFIMVHGNTVSAGCFAMTDDKIEEIYLIVDAALKTNQKNIPFHSFPCRMTSNNIKQLYRMMPKWVSFWQQLRPVYLAFETTREIPNVIISGQQYQLKERN